MGMALEGGEGGGLDTEGREGVTEAKHVGEGKKGRRKECCFVFTSWLVGAFDLMLKHHRDGKKFQKKDKPPPKK